MTTLHSVISYRKSICRLSVCNDRAPYSGGWSFRQYFFTAVYVSYLWPPCKILQRSSQRNPSIRGIKCKRDGKIERCWTYR